MNEFCEHLFDRRDQALEAAGDARGRLVLALDENDDRDFAEAMAGVARHQPYARWWMSVTDEIEGGGLDPMASLTKARTAARNTLIQQNSGQGTSLFKTAMALARVDAARRFFNDTAHFNLDAITGPGLPVPTIARTSPPPGPTADPTSPNYR